MSIRYLLFLIVGVLFTAIFIGSFLVENRIGNAGVKEVRKDLYTFYKDIEEEKRRYIDSILVANLSQRLGEVNAALEVVSKFSRIQEYFAPTTQNISKGTWRSSAGLLQDRERIDFIQNTYDGKVTSLITPQHGGMLDMFQEPIDDDLCWVYTSDTEEQKDPFLGVLLQMTTHLSEIQSQTESVPGIVLKVFVLYSKETIEQMQIEDLTKNLSSNDAGFALTIPFLEGYYLDVKSFVHSLAKAKAFLIEEEKDNLSFEEEENPLLGSENSSEVCRENVACYFDKRVEYVNQLFIIWELCCLIESKLVGDSVFSSISPKAISFFPDETGKGQGVFVKDVLSDTPLFDASKYFAAASKDQKSPSMSQSVALMRDPEKSTLFMGNTAELISIDGDTKKTGYITMGFDLENVLQELSLNFKQTAWIVFEDQIVASLLPSGEKAALPNVAQNSMHKLLEAPMGVFNWQGKSFYFVHLQPYPSLDLHFFLFNEAEVEFSLMKKLNKKIESLITKINEDRRYVILLGLGFLLLLLLNVTKKLTKPIVAMALAARSVKKGSLSDIHLPKQHLGRSNEVQQLSDAFTDMVEGLKEKEKVKGILDKVVSHDIAKEILKGDIHLGGEEREVTIFFADIRSFTSLTQKMDPHEVIDLINTCMTKLSHVIDMHHGVIDKYIGDEVMVLFGAPLKKEDSAYEAVICAIEIMKELKKWNEERTRQNLASVTMGIGIHTGKVCAGNMGAENRLNYTVIGSNVNLASRLCSTARPEEILISQDTLAAPFVAERIVVEDMGLLELKGFDDSKRVYKVQGLK